MDIGSKILTKRSHLGIGFKLLIVVGTALMLYLSLEGLAYRLWQKDVISHKTFATIYAPTLYLDHHCEWFSHFEDDYENLWYDQTYYILKNMGIKKDLPNTFFTVQDSLDFGMAAIVVGLGGLLIYFPQWTYRVALPEQEARKRKSARICGFIILASGLILFLDQCREILIYGF